MASHPFLLASPAALAFVLAAGCATSGSGLEAGDPAEAGATTVVAGNDAGSGSSSGGGSDAGQADGPATIGDAGVGGDVATFLPGDAGAGDASLPPMPTQSFLIGYNEAWFGNNFGTDYTTTFDLSYVQQIFDGIAGGGGHLVRLFLWEAPQGITLAATPPQSQSLSAQFLSNLDSTLWEARKRGLWIYLTLLDANTIAKDTGSVHAYGVNLLNNTSGEQDAFNASAVAPLLSLLDTHQDMIFGIDMINEIQAAYQNSVFPDGTTGAKAFLQREAAFIKSRSPWVKITSAAGWPSDILMTGAQYDIASGFYSGLGLDFYDLHVYADSGSFSGATAMCARAASDGVPVYLGEFGQSTHTVDDGIQSTATADFLNNARGLCFKGAFAWRFDPAESWWTYTHADLSYRPAVSIMKVFGAQP
jgi:hypothetical protein